MVYVYVCAYTCAQVLCMCVLLEVSALHQTSPSTTLLALAVETESLTEPGVRLVASKLRDPPQPTWD